MTTPQSETIIALSTPNGVGAIAVIRLSGNDAIAVTNIALKGKDLAKQASHTLHFGKLYDGETEIDEVVVAIYKAPNSYTKEDVVEISCHGSPYIVNRIIALFLSMGIQLAKPGEFTQRAFLNGRFDLTQAEAVADLIASDSEAAHKIALQQMRGGISEKLKELRTQLIEFRALLELELDFSEEDVEFADRTQFLQLLQTIREETSRLTGSFKFGNAIKNGIPVAIIGKPNAGKSTLLNALLQEERAIVSSIAGTTRDTIEETLTIDGYLFRFIDTAGLRDAQDEIEQIGIQRSKAAMDKAEIVILIYDHTHAEDGVEISKYKAQLEQENKDNKKIIIVANKMDAIALSGQNTLNDDFIAISAKNKTGIETLKQRLVECIANDSTHQNAVMLSNQRHYEALTHAQAAIDLVIGKMQQNIPSDLITQDIRTALSYIGDITGEIDIDRDILGTIFGKFCVGK